MYPASYDEMNKRPNPVKTWSGLLSMTTGPCSPLVDCRPNSRVAPSLTDPRLASRLWLIPQLRTSLSCGCTGQSSTSCPSTSADFACSPAGEFPDTATSIRVLSYHNYFGDLNSVASQPRMLQSIGSLEMIIVRTLPHFRHSKVRRAKPSDPSSIAKSVIRATTLTSGLPAVFGDMKKD
jgi:hypothetical protein